MSTMIRAVQIPTFDQFSLELPVGSEYLCVRHINGAPHLHYRCSLTAAWAPHAFCVTYVNHPVPMHMASAPYIDTFAAFEHDQPKILLGGLPG